MNRKHWVAVIGALGLAVGVSDCGNSGGGKKTGDTPPPGEAPPPTTEQTGNTVEGFLSDTGQNAQFDKKVAKSICQLEESLKVKLKLDPDKRLCPDGNPDKVGIPVYPPSKSSVK